MMARNQDTTNDDNDRQQQSPVEEQLLHNEPDTHKTNKKSLFYKGRLNTPSPDYRCGFVSIVGAPNQGKSTLLNALLREDLCIATPRPQTTRHAILGLLTSESCQVCLVDTPGVIEDPAYKLQENMMEAVIGAFHDADALLVVTDLFSTPIPNDDLFRKIQVSRKPVLVVINKVDLASRVNVTAATATATTTTSSSSSSTSSVNYNKTVTVKQAVGRWRQLLPQAVAIIPCTASHGPDDPGVVALRTILLGGPDVPAAIRNLGRPISGMFAHPSLPFLSNEDSQAILPISPPLYDTEALTDRTERFVASELIRASLFECLKKELPYCCEVRIDKFREPRKEDKKKIIRIEASVVVERDSQKLIVVGKGGEKIKEVGIRAREKLEDFLQSKVRAMWLKKRKSSLEA